MEAHSLYIEELAKFGLVGFASQYLAIGIGVIVMGIAAYKGFAGPLGLIVAFLVASLTEVFTNGWQLHSNYSLLLVLCVAAAAMWLVEGRDGSAPIAPGTTDESARIPVDA
jgi:O-antigen ligase